MDILIKPINNKRIGFKKESTMKVNSLIDSFLNILYSIDRTI